jgi:hypothetical protein
VYQTRYLGLVYFKKKKNSRITEFSAALTIYWTGVSPYGRCERTISYFAIFFSVPIQIFPANKQTQNLLSPEGIFPKAVDSCPSFNFGPPVVSMFKLGKIPHQGGWVRMARISPSSILVTCFNFRPAPWQTGPDLPFDGRGVHWAYPPICSRKQVCMQC